MRKSALMLLAAGVSLAFAPAPLPKPPRPDPSKEDLKKMQGIWVRVVFRTQVGGPVAVPAATRVKIAGNRMTYLVGATAMSEWSIALDATKGPKVFDNEGVGRGGPYRGIYRLEGDTLTICSRSGSSETDRPTDLEGTSPRAVLEVFTRERP